MERLKHLPCWPNVIVDLNEIALQSRYALKQSRHQWQVEDSGWGFFHWLHKNPQRQTSPQQPPHVYLFI